MNFIFISPNFPKTYWQFCRELRDNGVNVLGIGDEDYNDLTWEVKDSVHEYYQVDSLGDYKEMYRAVAYFAFKYGKIDFLESNNEYWMFQDAQLRTDFHITTGVNNNNIDGIKYKSMMKKYYEKAGVQTARYSLVTTFKKALAFIDEVGYPIIIKPDSGVGASDTFKINNQFQLENFFLNKKDIVWIMEEFIDGVLISYDGIAGYNREIIYETSHEYPIPIMELVNNKQDVYFWSVRKIDTKLKEIGRRVVKSFPTNARCFHTEYFILKKDKPGLGKAGDYIGLEVNMRPPGGSMPEMINYANDISYYKVYADMIAFGKSAVDFSSRLYFCSFASQRNEYKYVHSKADIISHYQKALVEYDTLPKVLAEAMGDDYYLARFKSKSAAINFCKYVIERK